MAMIVNNQRTTGPGTISFTLSDDGGGGDFDLTLAVINANFNTPLPRRLMRKFAVLAAGALAIQNALNDIDIIWTSANAVANQPRVSYLTGTPTIKFTGPGVAGIWNITARAPHSLSK